MKTPKVLLPARKIKKIKSPIKTPVYRFLGVCVLPNANVSNAVNGGKSAVSKEIVVRVYTVRSESGLHAATALCTGTRNNG